MIKENTVFILGAGASRPYNFGVGETWKSDIISNFLEDFEEICSVGSDYGPRNFLMGFAENLIENFKGTPQISIDQFLSHQDNETITRFGKMAIILSIKKYEINSHLPWKNVKLKGDWYKHLYIKMTSEKKLESFCNNKVAFITFNYDRSLEHFFYHSLKHDFGETDDTVIEALSNIPILHVYGQIAPLPWQGNKKHTLEYMDEYRDDWFTYDELCACINNIHIMGEDNENKSILEARNIIADSERILFLGFGYSKENLEILNMVEALTSIREKSIYGTGLGLEEREIDRCKRNFVTDDWPDNPIGSITRNIQIVEGCDCLNLLRHLL